MLRNVIYAAADSYVFNTLCFKVALPGSALIQIQQVHILW